MLDRPAAPDRPPGGQMHLAGETRIAAPRQSVWDALTDPRQVAECAPGEPDVEVVDERRIRVTAKVGNLVFRTTVVIDIELDEMEPPASATGRASGTVMGGPVSAVGSLRLEEIGPSLTGVEWDAEVALGGMLAGFAAMAEQPAKQAIDGTIDCLKARLEGETETGPAPTGA
jgi:carbon monoxide dehydrogenase subunit G